MNKQTKRYKKLKLCTKQVKGVSAGSGEGERTRSMCHYGIPIEHGQFAFQPRSRGTTASGEMRKPWKGGGDPLKRGRPDYNFSTPSPYVAKRTGFGFLPGPLLVSEVHIVPGVRRKRLSDMKVVNLIGA